MYDTIAVAPYHSQSPAVRGPEAPIVSPILVKSCMVAPSTAARVSSESESDQPHLRNSSSSSSSVSSPATVPCLDHATNRSSSTRRPTAAQQEAEQHRTADLIHQLYARLEEQGVPGDGWEEGLERSRDGIISEEVSEGEMTISARRKGKGRATTYFDRINGSALPAKEEALVRKTDRYGFFSGSHPAALACQHNRIAVLIGQPYSSFPSTSRRSKVASGSKNRPRPLLSDFALRDRSSSTASVLPLATPAAQATESSRISKWGTMLHVAARDEGGNVKDWKLMNGVWNGRPSNGGRDGAQFNQFQKRVYKGIPDRWRRAVWGITTEMFESGEAQRSRKSSNELARIYRSLTDQPSNQDVQIDLDVPRTISGHVLFHTRYGQGQRSLFHVLHALGLYCEDIGGYCQGMGPIAATFLCYFEPERAFACMVRLFDQYNLRHIFEPGFPGLVEAFYVQERLVEWIAPDVHRAFTTHGISTSSYATKWYITLFANSVPFATQLRLWDVLLLEGLDALIIIAVAIIWRFQGEFTASNASFESILSSLTSYFLVDSDDALMRWIRKVCRRKDLRQKMIEWRTEWRGYVRDGTAADKVT